MILPKTEYAKRDIWTADMIRLALDKCTDSKLYVAMNLSFACSLRMGEILGLTWENVHISDEDIAADNAYVYICLLYTSSVLHAGGFENTIQDQRHDYGQYTFEEKCFDCFASCHR